MSSNRELEHFASAVHGALAAGYLLTLMYHLKRKKWLYISVGVLGASYHVWSITNHLDD